MTELPSTRIDAKRPTLRALAALIAAVLAIGLLAGRGHLDGLQAMLRDSRLHLAPRAPVTDIVLVAIDTESIGRIDVWPWPRRTHATLVDRLNEVGARAIHFDVDFSSRSNPVDDEILADALMRSAAPVSLAAHVQLAATGEGLVERLPLPLFAAHAATASVVVVPGPRGLTRMAERGRRFSTGPAPSLAVLLAGHPPGEGSFAIDFSIDAHAVPVLSYADVMERRVDPVALKGKTVIVGATAIELGDILSVPGHALLPGPLVQVLAAETLAQGRIPHQPSHALVIGLVAALAIGLGLLVGVASGRLRLRTAQMVIAVALAATLTLGVVLETRGPVWLPTLAFGLAFVAAIVAMVSLRLVLQHRTNQAARRRIEWLATHDEATAALQRHALRTRLVAMDEDGFANSGLVAFELRRFAQVRETLGTDRADAVMARMVREISGSCGVQALARTGDVDFLAWIGGVGTAADVERIGEAIASRVRRVSSVATVSAGTLHFREFAQTDEEDASDGSDGSGGSGERTQDTERGRAARVAEAMLAVRLAKEVAAENGETVVPHSAEFVEGTRRRLRQELDLPGAIASEKLSLAYQPQICLRTGAITGVEALVRWIHPEMGFMRPDEFVAVAEASGAIDALGEWVLRRACTDIAPLEGAQGPLQVSVNVSPQQFVQSDVRALVLSALAESGLPIARLELEITESVAVRDTRIVRRALEPLREDGMKVALDDFGTGYAQLGTLGELPIDKIKLDRTLITPLPAPRATSVLSAAIAIARGHDLVSVAEGVEDEGTAILLRGAGCDVGQGYLWARPLPLDELCSTIAENVAALRAEARAAREAGRADGGRRGEPRRAGDRLRP